MKEGIAIVLGVFLVMGVIVWWLFSVFTDIDNRFDAWCHAQGGGVVVVRGPNICVAPDGRMIPSR